MKKYENRKEAGLLLSQYLEEYKNNPNGLILALPRGGVPVAYEVSKALSLPLDVFLVRKLGVPGHEELAMGAIASGGVTLFNRPLIKQLQLTSEEVNAVVVSEQKELYRREKIYRNKRDDIVIDNKVVILIDDGIATGATMRVAIKALKKKKPASIIIAVPVAAQSTCKEELRGANRVVCPLQVIDLQAVGLWYHDFSQVSDQEVIELLQL